MLAVWIRNIQFSARLAETSLLLVVKQKQPLQMYFPECVKGCVNRNLLKYLSKIQEKYWKIRREIHMSWPASSLPLLSLAVYALGGDRQRTRRKWTWRAFWWKAYKHVGFTAKLTSCMRNVEPCERLKQERHKLSGRPINKRGGLNSSSTGTPDCQDYTVKKLSWLPSTSSIWNDW